MIPGGEGLSGRAVWAEVAAGGDRRALRLHAQPDGAATAELQPSSLRISPASTLRHGQGNRCLVRPRPCLLARLPPALGPSEGGRR